MKLDDDDKFNLKVLGALVIIGLMVILFARYCHADERNYLSVGLGNTQFKQNDLGSGTWHQAPEYGTQFVPDAPARQLIIGRQVRPWLGLEFGLRDFGRSDIYGKWTTDDNYQAGHIGTEPFDTGFTSVRLRGYSIGANLSTRIVFDWFARAHLMRYQWDFDGYFTSGYSPKSTTIGSWHCNVRGTDPVYSVGVRFGHVTIEQTRFNVRHARESDVCTSNFTGGKTVFIGYEWRF